MECSKESLQEDSDKEYEPDKSSVSQVFRLIKSMATGEEMPRRKLQKRLGKGPGGERDMIVDSEEDDDVVVDNELSMVDIRARVMNAGWSEVVLMETISEVCSLSVSAGAFHDPLLP
jgi:DNA replication licensing factor MCM7